MSDAEVVAMKDGENQHPIPSAWRPIFGKIVNAFVHHDYKVSSDIPGVVPVSADTALQIENYIRDYGATLVELPEDAWNTSVCMWMGNRWDVLVDLWTEEEGSSDLVLGARVSESDSGFMFHVDQVYVP